jgi:sterol 3beta-glucosyltransferase
MVKSAGRLLPDLLSEEERHQLPEKMQMLRDIVFSTWPACTFPDPEDPTQTPFVADAIISNPVSYGHLHCAEALAIPLVRSFCLFDLIFSS